MAPSAAAKSDGLPSHPSYLRFLFRLVRWEGGLGMDGVFHRPFFLFAPLTRSIKIKRLLLKYQLEGCE